MTCGEAYFRSLFRKWLEERVKSDSQAQVLYDDWVEPFLKGDLIILSPR